MMIYQGDNWPEAYRGRLYTSNLHGNRINMDTLEREGCGYVGKHAPDFMKAKDKWFRGIDLLTGPDGNVFVADTYNHRVLVFEPPLATNMSGLAFGTGTPNCAMNALPEQLQLRLIVRN